MAGHVQVELADTDKKLYIEVLLADKGDEVRVIIEDIHTNVVEIRHGERIVFDRKDYGRAEMSNIISESCLPCAAAE